MLVQSVRAVQRELGHRTEYNSLGLESGRNILRGCADKRVDLSLSKDLRVGGSRRLEFRADVFNAFNAVVINARNTHGDVREPDEPHGRQQPVQRRRHPRMRHVRSRTTRASVRRRMPWRCATCSCSSASSSKDGLSLVSPGGQGFFPARPFFLYAVVAAGLDPCAAVFRIAVSNFNRF